MPAPVDFTPTAAGARALIPTWTDLGPAYRKRLMTVARALPRLFGKPAEAIRLDSDHVHLRLLKASAAEWGISAKSLPTYRSAARAILRRLGLLAQRRREAVDMPEPWRRLLDLLPPGYKSARIVPFAAFCVDRGLPLEAVGPAAVSTYMDHLASSLAVRCPRHTARMLVTAWNACGASLAGWTAPALAMPPPRATSYAPPFTDYPPSFQAEVLALQNRLLGQANGGRLYSDNDRSPPLAKPLRPAAVVSRMNALRLAAGALVLSGRPIETVTGLGCLVERDARRAICTWHWERAGKRATSNTGAVAGTLRVIARHVVRLEEAALRDVIADIAPLLPAAPTEITDKNIARLKQFEDVGRLAALLHLPERLMEEAKGLRDRGLSTQAAWMAGVAVATEIELAMPLRLSNLTELRLGDHLQGLSGRTDAVHITVPQGKVKNSVSLTFRLGPDAVALLRRYLVEFRPLAPNADTDFLFPNRDHRDAARQAGGFGKAIGEAVRRHIGAALNVHLFRCLAGVLILRENPDAINDLRLLLGHKSLETTLRFYALITREKAAERHVARITHLRKETRMQALAAFGSRKLRHGAGAVGRGSVR